MVNVLFLGTEGVYVYLFIIIVKVHGATVTLQ